MDILSRIAEEKIKTAQEEGQFERLPGRGKPLLFDEDALTHPDWRLAHHVLKAQGFVPAWIERRQEIEADLEHARAELRQAIRSVSVLSENVLTSGEREAALDRFKIILTSLNRRILSYNLLAPSTLFHLHPLQYQREIAALNDRPDQPGGAD